MKKKTMSIIIALILFIIGITIKFNGQIINNIILIISYVIVGIGVLKEALENILEGKVFDENFLMTVATIGAFAIGEIPEAVAVMLFYQIGELFEHYATDKSRKSIQELMNIRPDFANIYREDRKNSKNSTRKSKDWRHNCNKSGRKSSIRRKSYRRKYNT